jgi:hypothetical protein
MAYPNPIPTFTPEAFRKTMERVKESSVPDKEKDAVGALRSEIRDDSRD